MSHEAQAEQTPRCAGIPPLVKVYQPCTRYQCGVEGPHLGVPLILAVSIWQAYQVGPQNAQSSEVKLHKAAALRLQGQLVMYSDVENAGRFGVVPTESLLVGRCPNTPAISMGPRSQR